MQKKKNSGKDKDQKKNWSLWNRSKVTFATKSYSLKRSVTNTTIATRAVSAPGYPEGTSADLREALERLALAVKTFDEIETVQPGPATQGEVSDLPVAGRETITQRMRRLRAGMVLPPIDIPYRSRSRPPDLLTDSGTR